MITFKLKMFVIASILICFLIQAQGADKYTDENRPYEFGFSIDGEQHRHEKKDENGLIMGEFGFITADGVYHVTVYATDEQGRFKILSMKNIRVKPYPTYTGKQSTTPERQGHSLDLPASPPAAVVVPIASSTENNAQKSISIEPPGRSCSSCSLPTTSTPPPIVPQVNQAGGYVPNKFGAVESPKLPGPQSLSGPQNSNGPLPSQTFGNIPQAKNTLSNGPSSPQNLGNRMPQSPNNPSNGPSPPQTFGNSIPQTQNIPSNGPTPPQTFRNSIPQSQNISSLPQTPLEQGLVPPIQTPNSFTSLETPLEQSQSFRPSPSSPGILQAPISNYSPESVGSPVFLPQSKTPADDAAQAPISSQHPGDLQTSRQNVASGRSPKRLDDEPSFGSRPPPNSLLRGSANAAGFNQEAPVTPSKPTLISAQMQIVDKNTDIHHLNPGEKEGLPKGLTKDDMTHLLYTFNYTVGFHGHFEEGYTNGVKQGYYFVTGRNGVRTRIDYTADSTGFHPKISQEVLDLLSDDVPKPETEKEEKYGLKGYEFKWLYYPIEDRTS